MEITTIIGTLNQNLLCAVRKYFIMKGMATFEIGIYDPKTGGYNESTKEKINELLLKKICASKELFVVDLEPLSQDDKKAIQFASESGIKVTFLSNNENLVFSITQEAKQIERGCLAELSTLFNKKLDNKRSKTPVKKTISKKPRTGKNKSR